MRARKDNCPCHARPTEGNFPVQAATVDKGVSLVCDFANGGDSMQFLEERHQRVIQRQMVHALMNLFNCVLLQVFQKLRKLGNICKQDAQETTWKSSLFFAENGQSDQFRRRILFSKGGSRYNKWSDERL